MTEFTFTDEQENILEHLIDNDGMLLVQAGAGCGKTFIAKQAVKLLEPKTGLYTAFNKAIVKEGERSFKDTSIECKTFHALAYKYVTPSKNIEDLGYQCIEENISYLQKSIVIGAINAFFVSASADMYDFMDEYIEFDDPKVEVYLKELAVQYIHKMLKNEINPTFNFLLKCFHLMLVSKTVKCKYDFVILDEINDTTAVALEIFKLIDAPKKLGLGETNQAIYEFLNLVDGFEELADAPQLPLTNSFRCSNVIANNIQNFMREEVNEKFTFSGTDNPVANGNTLYCTLTNAKIIQEISDCMDSGKKFYLLRNVAEIFSYPLAIVQASRGKSVYKKQHKFLEEEYQNYERNRTKGYSFLQHLMDNVGDQETTSAVNLLLTLRRKNINIFDLYKRAKDAPVDMRYTIATVFTAKGLEYETVRIADDLNNRISSIREAGGIKTKEDLVAYRCYYVAASRAGSNLLNANCLQQ